MKFRRRQSKKVKGETKANTNKRSVFNNKKGEEKVAKTIKKWEDNDGKRRSKIRNYKGRLQNADKGVGEE